MVIVPMNGSTVVLFLICFIYNSHGIPQIQIGSAGLLKSQLSVIWCQFGIEFTSLLTCSSESTYIKCNNTLELPQAVPCGVLPHLEMTTILQVALHSLFFNTWFTVNKVFVVLSNLFISMSIHIYHRSNNNVHYSLLQIRIIATLLSI